MRAGPVSHPGWPSTNGSGVVGAGRRPHGPSGTESGSWIAVPLARDRDCVGGGTGAWYLCRTMRLAMSGSSGLIGNALRGAFSKRGWTVTRVTRRVGGGRDEVRWDPDRGEIDASGLEGHDAVIHLAGESLFGIWTPGKKRRIVESRLGGTDLLCRSLASLEDRPGVLLSGSAVGYYGNRDPANPVAEDAGPGGGFLAELCVRWEAATKPAEEAGIRVVHLRTANVLTPEGGVLGVLLPIVRLGLAATFGPGTQMFPWITLEDYVHAVIHILETPSLRGAVNLASPGAVTNAQFTRSLARVANRWVLLTIPSWALRLAPGGMADEMLLPGARVEPRRLLETGFEFGGGELQPALEAMLAR